MFLSIFFLVSDIAIFVLKRDVKLQLTLVYFVYITHISHCYFLDSTLLYSDIYSELHTFAFGLDILVGLHA